LTAPPAAGQGGGFWCAANIGGWREWREWWWTGRLAFLVFLVFLFMLVDALVMAGVVPLVLVGMVVLGFTVTPGARWPAIDDGQQDADQRQRGEELRQTTPGTGGGQGTRESIEPITVHYDPSQTSRQ
jgi:hypothetical protein